VKKKLYKGNYIIIVVYHSSGSSDPNFVRFPENIVEKLIKRECIVIGNFNIDFMIDSIYTKKLQTTMLSWDLCYYNANLRKGLLC